jgi:hypothetical protein
MRTAVVYTFPFETTAALRAMAEIERMGNLDALGAAAVAGIGIDGPEEKNNTEDAQAMQERILELRQRRDELIATLPPVRQVRLLVRAVRYNDQTQYRVLYKEGMEWFKAQTGRELDDDFGGEPELASLRDMAIYRAEMLCAVERRRENGKTIYVGEERSFAYGKEPTTLTETWQAWALPAEWTALDTMGDALPYELFDEWLAATRELNAGVLPTIPFFFRTRRATRSVIA